MNSLLETKLKTLVLEGRTLLGVGPMSGNCVDAAIEVSNETKTPLMLIASRRQIDSEEFGGGYVNNWSTKDLSDYVLKKDKLDKIILCRDHGGPWQNPKEKDDNLGLRLAMESAKRSYAADINAGFQILHIDPSVDIHDNPSCDEILNRVYELYEYCYTYAKSKNKQVSFEVGTEEQSGGTNSVDRFEYTLGSIIEFCKKNKLPKPLFIVAQCGTRVCEMKNVGTFDSPFRVQGELPAEIQLPKVLEVCQKYDVFMKEHNADYLSEEAIRWHPKLKLPAANVAPEFGVCETKAIVELLKNNSLHQEADNFLELAYNSKKWQKWMAYASEASDFDKSLIAGHYVFSTPEFHDLKVKCSDKLKKKHIDMDRYLTNSIKKSILRFCEGFHLVRRTQ
jgi:hypothetical protein